MLNPPKILMYSKTSMTTTLDPQWSLGSIHKPRRYHSSSRWSLVPKKILYIFLDGTLRINTQVSSKYHHAPSGKGGGGSLRMKHWKDVGHQEGTFIIQFDAFSEKNILISPFHYPVGFLYQILSNKRSSLNSDLVWRKSNPSNISCTICLT